MRWVALLVFACAIVAPAQTVRWGWICQPVGSQPSLQVTGQPHHQFALQRFRCAAQDANSLFGHRFTVLSYFGTAESHRSWEEDRGYAVSRSREGAWIALRFHSRVRTTPKGKFISEHGVWHLASSNIAPTGPGPRPVRGSFTVVVNPRHKIMVQMQGRIGPPVPPHSRSGQRRRGTAGPARGR